MPFPVTSPSNEPSGELQVSTETNAAATVLFENQGKRRVSPEDWPGLSRGTLLGRYVILDRLGQGGMGIVFTALDPELGRTVAIKVILSQDIAEFAQENRLRLLREAQAMASVSHPHIVAVYDVGIVDERAFVAMEKIDGVTLTLWLKQRPRKWRAVLHLFRQAALGLSAAHAKGLIHRDFKPDNVLVDAYDQIKIVDFGLAAASASPWPKRQESVFSDSFDRIATTRAHANLDGDGLIVGSPPYMSPEQHRGETTDGRSDQFSYCVALYEALFGMRPFAGAKYEDFRAAILTGSLQPMPKSAAVPRWLRNLVLRGLSSAPEQRFGDFSEILEVIDQHDRSWGKNVLLAAGGLIVPLATIVAPISRAQDTCHAAAEPMERKWDDAQRYRLTQAFYSSGRTRAGDNAAFAVEALDTYARLWQEQSLALCESAQQGTKAEQILADRGKHCMDRRLQNFAAVVAVLRRGGGQTIDRASEVIADLEPIESCREVQTLRQLAPEPTSAHQGNQLAELQGELARARAIGHTGRTEESIAILDRIIDQSKQLGYAPFVAEVHLQRAHVLEDADFPRLSERAYQQAKHAATIAHHDMALAYANSGIVNTTGRLSHFAEVSTLSEAALASIARAGNSPTLLADFAIARGFVASLAGDYVEAEVLMAQALDGFRRNLGPYHFRTGTTLMSVGFNYYNQGKLDLAIDASLQAIMVLNRSVGTQHPMVGGALTNLGAAYSVRDMPAQARACYEQALEPNEHAYGKESTPVAALWGNIGLTYGLEGRYHEVITSNLKTIEIFAKNLGESHPWIATGHTYIGEAYLRLGQVEKAKMHAEKALNLLRRAYGSQHPELARATILLGDALTMSGNLPAGEVRIFEGLNFTLSSPVANRKALDLYPAHSALARNLSLQGRYLDAVAQHQHAMKVLQSEFAEEHLHRVSEAIALAKTHLRGQNWQQSSTIIIQNEALIRARRSDTHPLVLETDLLQATIALRQGEWEAAQAKCTSVVQRLEQTEIELDPIFAVVAKACQALALARQAHIVIGQNLSAPFAALGQRGRWELELLRGRIK